MKFDSPAHFQSTVDTMISRDQLWMYSVTCTKQEFSESCSVFGHDTKVFFCSLSNSWTNKWHANLQLFWVAGSIRVQLSGSMESKWCSSLAVHKHVQNRANISENQWTTSDQPSTVASELDVQHFRLKMDLLPMCTCPIEKLWIISNSFDVECDSENSSFLYATTSFLSIGLRG